MYILDFFTSLLLYWLTALPLYCGVEGIPFSMPLYTPALPLYFFSYFPLPYTSLLVYFFTGLLLSLSLLLYCRDWLSVCVLFFFSILFSYPSPILPPLYTPLYLGIVFYEFNMTREKTSFRLHIMRIGNFGLYTPILLPLSTLLYFSL